MDRLAQQLREVNAGELDPGLVREPRQLKLSMNGPLATFSAWRICGYTSIAGRRKLRVQRAPLQAQSNPTTFGDPVLQTRERSDLRSRPNPKVKRQNQGDGLSSASTCPTTRHTRDTPGTA